MGQALGAGCGALVRPRPFEHPPVVGAAILALELAGVHVSTQTRAALAGAISGAPGHAP